MTRITSEISFRELVSSGKIKGRRLQVLEDVCRNPGTTQGEVVRRITQVNPSIKERSLTPRFAELVNRGLLLEQPARDCGTTGKHAITYSFSGLATIQQQVKKPTLLTVVKVLEKIAESSGELSEKAKIALDMIDRVI